MKSCLPLVFLFTFFCSEAWGRESPLPRFVSLRSNEVNGRVGPGSIYPVEWVYVKSGLPIEIIAEFDTWRKIRDVEGTEVWVHQSMLTSKRHVILQEEETLLYVSADVLSRPLARLQKGVIGKLLKCREGWCQIQIQNYKGWVPRAHLWGVYAKEKVG